MTTDEQLSLEILLTPDGMALLRAELDELVNVARPASQRRVQAAFESGEGEGDTEIADARWEQDRIEMRIRRLEDQLRIARVVTDVDLDHDRIAIGHRVDVRRADGTERSYVLVSPAESDPRRGRLSSESPLGRALLGRRVGDVVVLEHNEEEVTVTGMGAA
jgi:transcription elongation factor GreA